MRISLPETLVTRRANATLCGTTVVMVTHEHTLVNEFNHRVVTIDEGQVVSDDRLDK